jgi:hypothetical protein
VTGADGVSRPQAKKRERHVMTEHGEVEVGRLGYSARDTASLMPLDAELNLPPDGFSFGVRKRVARLATMMSFGEVCEEINTTTRAHIGPRQAQELTKRAALDYDAFYASRHDNEAALPDEAPAQGAAPPFLALSTDAKGVVVRAEALREAAKAKREPSDKVAKTLSRLLSKQSNKRKKNHKRMAQAAAVFDIAPYERSAGDVVLDFREPGRHRPKKAPRPANKRVWASVEKDEGVVIAEMFAEAERRDAKHERDWVVLVDGDESQLQAILKCARALGAAVTIILDVIHALQGVWAASKALAGDSDEEREAWVMERFERLLSGDVSLVAAGMRRSATKRGLSKEARKPVDQCADYLLKYKDYLRYDQYLAKGMPIATGVIEGTCRNLINDRLDITGARWGLTGAEAVLRLRSLRKSGDFEAYWAFHVEQEYRRNHLSHYQDEEPPTPAVVRPRLSVIEGGGE